MQLGVADYAAHMFIFYYAVLSEVSPPTALSPFAAAAVTGGDPSRRRCNPGVTCRRSSCLSCSCSIRRTRLLLMGSFKKLAVAPWGEIAIVSVTAMIGIAALAAGVQGWLFKKTTSPERWMLIIGPCVVSKAMLDYIGVALIVVVIMLQKLRKGPMHVPA